MTDLNHCSKCKNKAELKIFNTFQYYYCNICKIECLEKEELATKTYHVDLGFNYHGFYDYE